MPLSLVLLSSNAFYWLMVWSLGCSCCFFFFQAEDGIRDLTVTGVQTCALPIYRGHRRAGAVRRLRPAPFRGGGRRAARPRRGPGADQCRARPRQAPRRAYRLSPHRDGRAVLPEVRVPSRPAHRRRPGRPRVDGVHDRVPGERAGDGSAVALVLQPRLLRKSLRRGLLLRGEVLGDFDPHFHVLVAAPAVLLDPLPRDAESLAVLRAGRHLEHHALPVQRPHLDPGAKHRLREVDRHHTRDVEASALAPENPARLAVDPDDDVAPPPRALALQPEPRAVVGTGRNVDHQALVDLHVPRALTRGAALRRDLPAAAKVPSQRCPTCQGAGD